MEPTKYAYEIELSNKQAGNMNFIVIAEGADDAIAKAKRTAREAFNNKFHFELKQLTQRTTELVL
jgi:hypothetical protein